MKNRYSHIVVIITVLVLAGLFLFATGLTGQKRGEVNMDKKTMADEGKKR